MKQMHAVPTVGGSTVSLERDGTHVKLTIPVSAGNQYVFQYRSFTPESARKLAEQLTLLADAIEKG